ncbi:MAG: CAP domain-containing protein [Deltaproteobacteria bacterium]|nr:CAP domain-containing protein [Deltaproteobacteria bacterium]
MSEQKRAFWLVLALLPSACVYVGVSDDEIGDTGTEAGDGDGDPSTGDGDGDTGTGDGDGDTSSTGDGDGDTSTGDGDGDTSTDDDDTSTESTDTGQVEGCTDAALEIIAALNAYREENSLPAIPASPSLCTVANAHVHDLADNNPVMGECNLHSWSDQGPWTACCYTPDHAQAQCMWDKPRELSIYMGNGYENAAYGVQSPMHAVDLWKSSPPHNEVMLNQGIWQGYPWGSVGADLYEGYAVLWFGVEADPVETEPAHRFSSAWPARPAISSCCKRASCSSSNITDSPAGSTRSSTSSKRFSVGGRQSARSNAARGSSSASVSSRDTSARRLASLTRSLGSSTASVTSVRVTSLPDNRRSAPAAAALRVSGTSGSRHASKCGLASPTPALPRRLNQASRFSEQPSRPSSSCPTRVSAPTGSCSAKCDNTIPTMLRVDSSPARACSSSWSTVSAVGAETWASAARTSERGCAAGPSWRISAI